MPQSDAGGLEPYHSRTNFKVELYAYYFEAGIQSLVFSSSGRTRALLSSEGCLFWVLPLPICVKRHLELIRASLRFLNQ